MTPEQVLADASPINYIGSCAKLPAVLFLNGDDDQIIPMRQGLRFCEKIRQNGGRAEFIKIAGGFHGRGCWGQEAMESIIQFFKVYL